MKYIGAGILGLIIGVAGSWLVFGKTLGAFSQLGAESHLSSIIKYIEVLDTKDKKTLRDTLISGLPCLLKAYEDGFQSYFWSKGEYAESLIAKAKRYNLPACPN